jgi:two-component system, LuxR family, response regulator DctR
MTAKEVPVVHIIDDDPAIRDALAWLFKSRGVVAHGWPSGESFLDVYRPDLEGCIVIDIRMDRMSGMELFDRLLARGATQPVVFLTGHGDVPIAVEVLQKGAADFLEKPFNDNELVDRVLRAIAKASERAGNRSRRQAIEARLAELSGREREVMDRLLAGSRNKQIADELGITMRTVEVHRARILEKMGVRNAVELARLVAGVLDDG